jgi:hypothetical protein
MKGSSCVVGLTAGLWALVAAGPAAGQENLDAGKNGAQLFASNCSTCHKSPRGLSKSSGLFGVESFLREHYTSSREAAASIADYLKTADQGASPDRKRTAKPKGKGDEKAAGKDKPSEKGPAKPGETKTDEAKPSEAKPGEAKPDETKPGDTKSGETKPGDAKPSETKPSETKASIKSDDAKPEKKKAAPDKKPAEAKTESKSDAKTEDKPADAKPGAKSSASDTKRGTPKTAAKKPPKADAAAPGKDDKPEKSD